MTHTDPGKDILVAFSPRLRYRVAISIEFYRYINNYKYIDIPRYFRYLKCFLATSHSLIYIYIHMLPVHNQGLGELAYRCSWMEKGYCHMVRATAAQPSGRALPRQKLMEFPWQFHLVAAAGGSSMEPMEPLKGAKASHSDHSAYASTVDIVLILLEGSSVCSLGVNLHVGLVETKRMAISLLCLTSRFSWLIILKLASLPDCLHIVPAGRFKVSNSSNVCSNMFNGRA